MDPLNSVRTPSIVVKNQASAVGFNRVGPAFVKALEMMCAL